jgi:hypothetical protein
MAAILFMRPFSSVEEFKESTLKGMIPKPIIGHHYIRKTIAVTPQIEVAIDTILAGFPRQFKFTWLRRKMRELKDLVNGDFINAFAMTFWKLKIASDSFKELLPYCVILYNELFRLDNQVLYQETMELIAPLAFMLDRAAGMALMDKLIADRPELEKFSRLLFDIPQVLWIPVNFFPLYNYDKGSKMWLTWVPTDTRWKVRGGWQAGQPPPPGLDVFREKVKSFISKYGGKDLLVPDPRACTKIGLRKYNDGGVVRHDSERPVNSRDSQFLYSAYLTKHLTPRETWIPGKAIKNLNSWWFSFVDPILQKVPYYCGGKKVEDIASLMPMFLEKYVKFDITGFGLQYRRELIEIILDEFSIMYPHPTVEDMKEKVLRSFQEIDIQMPDKHIQPPRGLGLGYFETLKTIGILAAIDEFQPVAIFGDQGLLRYHDRRTMDALRYLQNLGFIFKDASKIEFTDPNSVYWAGSCFRNGRDYTTPRSVWSSLSGALEKEFHWERKAALKSLSFEAEWKHIWKYISFQYEFMFGHEFYHGESICHFLDGGVNPFAEPTQGFVKVRRAVMLETPAYKWKSNILHVQPWGYEAPRGESKRFSILRKRTYQNTKVENLISTFQYEYIYPIIEYNLSKKVTFTEEARATPTWMDLRNLLINGHTTRKVVSGLSDDEMLVAPDRQRYASNPFEARASGGYRIITSYHGTRGPDKEIEDFCQLVVDKEDTFLPRALKLGGTPEYVHYESDPERFKNRTQVPIPVANPYRQVRSLQHLEDYIKGNLLIPNMYAGITDHIDFLADLDFSQGIVPDNVPDFNLEIGADDLLEDVREELMDLDLDGLGLDVESYSEDILMD